MVYGSAMGEKDLVEVALQHVEVDMEHLGQLLVGKILEEGTHQDKGVPYQDLFDAMDN